MGIMLSIMYLIWHWQKLLKNYYYLHIINEETESKRGEIIYPKIIAKNWQNQGEIQISDTKACALKHETILEVLASRIRDKQ